MNRLQTALAAGVVGVRLGEPPAMSGWRGGCEAERGGSVRGVGQEGRARAAPGEAGDVIPSGSAKWACGRRTAPRNTAVRS